MTCSACRAALSARLDGEPSHTSAEETGAGRHLAGCADCRDWLAVAQRLRELARSAPGPSPEWTRALLAGVLGPEAPPVDRCG
ncbi:zf-HC2 domain-containing protein [Peterkaempfera bronchialis]|uniref:zf-HC2 domain-containing protein n=1 Tax=Peterkaempfera bronchialis TaxID=2126346 RepID=UPI000DBBF711|nr:zf-HC2 domain-containing protein [Peterkaempfera bronchialis]